MSRALNFDGKQLTIIDRADPIPAPGEVIIQPRLMGICSTDLHLINGYRNFEGVPGHEFVGTVIAGPDEWLNKRVVGEINITCGQCDMCRRDIPTQCRNRSALGIFGNYDGAFADTFRLPITNLHRVPDTISDKQAVFTEPLAAACQILQQVHIQPDNQVVVVGIGRLGALVAQVLHVFGLDITGVVRHRRQSELLERWGIKAHAIDEIKQAQADVVVDCTGHKNGFADALSLVRPRGTLILKSTYAELTPADLTKVAVDEIQLVGSRCGPFDVALRLLERNTIDVESLIEATYPLDNFEHAFEHAVQRGVLKILLKPR